MSEVVWITGGERRPSGKVQGISMDIPLKIRGPKISKVIKKRIVVQSGRHLFEDSMYARDIAHPMITRLFVMNLGQFRMFRKVHQKLSLYYFGYAIYRYVAKLKCDVRPYLHLLRTALLLVVIEGEYWSSRC